MGIECVTLYCGFNNGFLEVLKGFKLDLHPLFVLTNFTGPDILMNLLDVLTNSAAVELICSPVVGFKGFGLKTLILPKFEG